MPDTRDEKMAHIVRAVAAGRYRYTYHGAQQRIARRIQGDDVATALANGAVIEDYPDHRFGPACLVLGRTASGEPLHKEVAMTQASAARG